jgi:arabinogalactan endo-1,4-beta-galactosidase
MLRKAREGVRNASNGAKQQPKIILQIERGADKGHTNWFFDNLKPHFDDFDVIGVSFYSIWNDRYKLEDLKWNLSELSKRGKDVAVMETGYPYKTSDGVTGHPGYALTEAGQKQFITDICRIVDDIPGGLGILYQSPEWISSWWKNNALFDENGQALPSLEALGGRSS